VAAAAMIADMVVMVRLVLVVVPMHDRHAVRLAVGAAPAWHALSIISRDDRELPPLRAGGLPLLAETRLH
jgi:hypothetical protein